MATASKVEGAKSQRGYFKFEGEAIDNLDVSPNIGRFEELTDSHVDKLALSIFHEGQKVPVIIRSGPTKQPQLIAGRHRRAAVILVNQTIDRYIADEFTDKPETELTELQAAIVARGTHDKFPLNAIFNNLSDIDAVKTSLIENRDNLPPTCIDIATAIANLENLAMTNNDIARTLQMHATRISQLKAYIPLPREIKHDVHNGIVPESTLKVLLRHDWNGKGKDATDDMVTTWRALRDKSLSVKEFKQTVLNEKRTKGEVIKRSGGDLRDLLIKVKSVEARLMIRWLDGEVGSDDEIVELFNLTPLPEKDSDPTPVADTATAITPPVAKVSADGKGKGKGKGKRGRKRQATPIVIDKETLAEMEEVTDGGVESEGGGEGENEVDSDTELMEPNDDGSVAILDSEPLIDSSTAGSGRGLLAKLKKQQDSASAGD